MASTGDNQITNIVTRQENDKRAPSAQFGWKIKALMPEKCIFNILAVTLGDLPELQLFLELRQETPNHWCFYIFALFKIL